jgi:hypothetical protein
MQLTTAQARAIGIKLSVKPRRPKKPPAPDSYIPHDCVILAIDPGKTSGWAVRGPRHSHEAEMIASGECSDGSMAVALIHAAKAVADKTKRPLIVVAETWTTGDRVQDRRMQAATLLGLGAAWGQWQAALREAGLPKSRIVRVNVATWRAKVIGGPMARTSEEWKAAAMRIASGMYPNLDRALLQRDRERKIGPDEAEALCIMHWATHAGAVGVAVKKAGRRYP